MRWSGHISDCKEKGYRIKYSRPNVDIIIVSVIDDSCVHQSGHLALIFVQFFVVIVHRGFGFFLELWFISVQVVPQPIDTLTAEHTKDVPLLLRELWGSFSAECSETFLQELLDTGQTQMSQAWTAIQQSVNTLSRNVSIAYRV
jgi:hypothetical protein